MFSTLWSIAKHYKETYEHIRIVSGKNDTIFKIPTINWKRNTFLEKHLKLTFYSFRSLV